MNAIQVSMLVFAGVEVLNILELYFMQDRCMFNGVPIFRVWERAQHDPEIHQLTDYLVNWIAGVKMIGIGLILVVVFTAPFQTQVWAAIALILTISAFYWRMFPTMRASDNAGMIQPAGRSTTLGWMVLFLMLTIAASVLIEVL